MTWGIILFLFALVLIVFLLIPITLQVNDLEKKLEAFISRLNHRYSLERLKKADEDNKSMKEKLKERVKRFNT
jgi:hypothetical protein